MSDSLAAICGWTLARTAILCLWGWPIAAAIERWLRGTSDLRRWIPLAIMMAPFLFPELLVGYAYRNLALANPKRAEVLCAGLLLVRIVPVGVISLLLSPAAIVSSSAIHCRWIIWRANRWSPRNACELARCYLEGPIRRAAPALGLMSLVAFQEFELAALLQTSSWTDWFIAAQRMGLERGEMLRQSLWPICIQLPLLLAVAYWLTKANLHFDSSTTILNAASGWTCVAVLIYLGIALVAGCLIPLIIIGQKLPNGLELLVRQPMQSRGLALEILIAATVSLCAGSTSWIASSAWTSPTRRALVSSTIRHGLLIPGLIGSLLLGLAMVVLFQQIWLRPAYDTPIPWTLALAVWLMPRAVLLRLWVGMTVQTQATYVAQLLVERSHHLEGSQSLNAQPFSSAGPQVPSSKSYDLLFRLRDQPHWHAIGLLCYWAYLDLSTAYLLHPSSMEPGLVRLYNFMHFGRSSALSAESLFFFGVPLIGWLSIGPILKLLRHFWR